MMKITNPCNIETLTTTKSTPGRRDGVVELGARLVRTGVSAFRAFAVAGLVLTVVGILEPAVRGDGGQQEKECAEEEEERGEGGRGDAAGGRGGHGGEGRRREGGAKDGTRTGAR